MDFQRRASLEISSVPSRQDLGIPLAPSTRLFLWTESYRSAITERHLQITSSSDSCFFYIIIQGVNTGAELAIVLRDPNIHDNHGILCCSHEHPFHPRAAVIVTEVVQWTCLFPQVGRPWLPPSNLVVLEVSGFVFGKIRFGCRKGGGKGLDESELVLAGVSRAFGLDASSTRASSASCRGAL